MRKSIFITVIGLSAAIVFYGCSDSDTSDSIQADKTDKTDKTDTDKTDKTDTDKTDKTDTDKTDNEGNGDNTDVEEEPSFSGPVVTPDGINQGFDNPDNERGCIAFKDNTIKQFAFDNWDLDNNRCISREEAALVTKIPDRAFSKISDDGKTAHETSDIKTLDDLNQFPNLKTIGKEAFRHNTGFSEINLKNITTVEEGAFKECNELQSVNMPAVIKLYREAFQRDKKLKNVFMPKLTEALDFAFSETAIDDISLPELITTDQETFSECKALKKIDLPKITHLSTHMFENCTALTEQEWFKNVIYIDPAAFAGCTSLKKADFPNAVIVNNGAFDSCDNLETVILPKAAYLGDSLFSGDFNLKEIELTNENNIAVTNSVGANIHWSAFGGIKTFRTTLKLNIANHPNSLSNMWPPEAPEMAGTQREGKYNTEWEKIVTVGTIPEPDGTECLKFTEPDIEKYALTFWDTNNDKCIDQTEARRVTAIAQRAFHGSNGIGVVGEELQLKTLDDLNLFPNLKLIGESAFSRLQHLKTVDLKYITDMYSFAFKDCDVLESVSFPNAINIGTYAFATTPALKTAALPKAEIINHNAFSVSGLESIDISSAKIIDYEVFHHYPDKSSLKNVTLGSVEYIGENAFENCAYITSPDFSTVKYVGDKAFKGCTRLTSNDFNQVTEIGKNAFENCTAIKNPSFKNVTYIGDRGLYGLTNAYAPGDSPDFSKLEFAGAEAFPIEIGENPDFSALMYAGEKAFAGATFKNPKFKTLKNIAPNAFEGCKSLRNPNLNTVISVGDRAFMNCTNLTSANLTKAKNIGREAFKGCSKLKEGDFGQVRKIGEMAFENCSSLKNPNFENLRSISRSAFKNCTALENPNFKTANYIDQHAFAGCSALNTPVFENVRYIAGGAFAGCSALKNPDLKKAEYIDDEAFAGCSALDASFTNAKMIGKGAFKDCKNLKTPALDNAVMINTSAFDNCTSIKTLSLPNAACLAPKISDVSFSEVQLTGDKRIMAMTGAFPDKMTDTVLTVHAANSPDSEKKLWAGTEWKEIRTTGTAPLPDKKKCITFKDAGIKKYALENWNLDGDQCIDEVEAALVTIIPPNAFSAGDYEKTDIKSLDDLNQFPNLKTIGRAAFANKKGLNELNLSNIESVDSYAFADCSKLNTVKLPKLKLFNRNIFYSCEKLTDIQLTAKDEIVKYSKFDDSYGADKDDEYIKDDKTPFNSNDAILTIHLNNMEKYSAPDEWAGVRWNKIKIVTD